MYKRQHHLLPTVNVGVEDADDVLEIITDDEGHVGFFGELEARAKAIDG